MPAVRRKPAAQVGQTWEGRSKVGYPFTRRRITEITTTHVRWEISGTCFKAATSGTITIASWLAWAKHLVNR